MGLQGRLLENNVGGLRAAAQPEERRLRTQETDVGALLVIWRHRSGSSEHDRMKLLGCTVGQNRLTVNGLKTAAMVMTATSKVMMMVMVEGEGTTMQWHVDGDGGGMLMMVTMTRAWMM